MIIFVIMIEQEETFLKLCETLIRDGFTHFTLTKQDWWKEAENRKTALGINAHYSLVFSFEFAKFVWGEKDLEEGKGPAWKFHLSKLSQEEDKLSYIDNTYLSLVSQEEGSEES